LRCEQLENKGNRENTEQTEITEQTENFLNLQCFSVCSVISVCSVLSLLFIVMQPFQLYLMRHGEVGAAAQGRLNGWTDVALSPRGQAQARWLAAELAHVEWQGIHCSDLQRATNGAQLFGLPIQADPAWREISMGAWEGCALNELDAQAIAHCFENPAAFTYPNGESFAAFAERIAAALTALRQQYPSSGAIALVAHGAVNRAILGEALSLPINAWLRLAQDYGCLNLIEWYDEHPLVRLVNRVLTDAELQKII
jgi:alpha-ribazole phosphatase